MRWMSEKAPKLGARRVVRRFLLWPTWLDGEWRWLERAGVNQVFAETVRHDGMCMYHVCLWLDHSWADERKDWTKRKRKGKDHA